ncbi:sulfite exporter TauE/SafE family protein [Paraferrimonas sp. SM1919]|uniref:sulfite exporter TauE/SafE family protein n=1 Tax=Paraferrimonas sp. SM1919 TaxID=2662263 RepID=UPI0013D3020A|nr:sulfite exporter TauE/SafE family protein [Paraferrimonas sp. SM1919]
MESFYFILIAGLLLGLFQGFFAGLLGIGGGIIIVPALLYLLPGVNVPAEHVAHMAIATSLASVVVSSTSSVFGHHKRGNVPWQLGPGLLPGITLGAFSGGFIAELFSSDILQAIFACFLVTMALRMAIPGQPKASAQMPSNLWLAVWTFLIAAFASLMGVGGGILLVPFLVYFSLDLRKALGCSSVCGAIIAFIGAFSYIITGWNEVNLPQYSIGYVYLPILLGLISTSMFTARLGVKAAGLMPVSLLKKIFASFMAIVGFSLLLG